MQEFYLDKPVDNEVNDAFQRYEFAKRIAKIVDAPKIEKSLVIGLYGMWGEGKTTIMNFIRAELSEDTVVVNFNPWLFSDQDSLIKSFFSAVAHALKGSLKSAKEKIGNFLSDYAEALGAFEMFSPIPFKDGAKAVGNKLKEQSIESIKQKVDDLIIKSGKNIVVFVDDIDRLDIKEIQYLFKLIKLVADFPRTSYILAFDDELVAKSLAPKYGSGNDRAGYAFLEKIIQMPLKIPKANKKQLRTYTVSLINTVLSTHNILADDKDLRNFVIKFDEVLLPFLDNPRVGIRYANALSFALPLLYGEANVCDVMLIEGIRVFFPELYDYIRINGHLMLYKEAPVSDTNYDRLYVKREGIKKEILRALELYGSGQSERIQALLLFLFPQLEEIFSNKSYSQESYTRWYRSMRICSYKYFERYFTYVVNSDDISDIYFKELFSDLATTSSNELSLKFRQEFPTINVGDLIIKLRYSGETYNEDESTNLALALVGIGDLFPLDNKDFLTPSTMENAAYFIAQLVHNTSEDGALELCKDLVKNAEPLVFAMKVDRALNSLQSRRYSQMLLHKEHSDELKEITIQRFREACKNSNLFDILPDVELGQILEWWSKSGSGDTLKTLLSDLMITDKNLAISLLRLFADTVTSYGDGTKEIFKANFNYDSYKVLSNIVEADVLYASLIKIFGDIGSNSVDNSQNRPLSDKDLVALFQHYYIDDISNIVPSDDDN